MRLVNLIGSIVLLAAGCANLPQRARITTSFDLDWRFLKADVPVAEQPTFDDAPWRTLSVPHDWSIEGPYDQNNPTSHGGGYLPSGIGWYRKHFTLPTDYAQRRAFIEFDGVMANSDVWVNGFHLGKRPYGYVSFRYELTGHLNFGPDKPNVLAVRADNSAQPASRWYTGAGIYRHVRLVVTDPVHIDQWGVFVTTPKVASDQAVVHVQTTVVNQSDTPREVTLQTTILAPDGKAVQPVEASQTIPAGKSVYFQQDITVKNPQLWDLDHPNLYSVSSKVLAAGATLDDDITPFGIREFRFDAATGFWLNGKNMKLKGVCLHHDGGGLGAAVPLRAWERRFELLKQVGVNAIRTAHNPPAPDFLDLCDRMGLLVMDELFDCWTVAKNPCDYHLYFNEWSKIDARDTVRRDRNHPSIILYSAGNEIHDTPNAELARGILKGLVEVFHEADPARPVTQALFRPNVSRDYDNGLADMLDVIGQNYREGELVAAHQAKPERKVLGTENGHDQRVWLALRDNEFMSGQFLWSGIDYLGEANWPNISSRFGLIDRTGTFRPRAYERQSWWSNHPMVHIVRVEPALTGTDERRRRGYDRVSNWTPRDPATYTEANVEVYSNCEQVEIILNGKSLGSQPRPSDDASRTWKVPFESGTIKALGKNEEQVVASHELRTAGKPAKIVLAADRTKLTPAWDDVSYVTVTVADGNDVLCPWSDDLITFNISGPGVIAAVDSGDIASHEPFQASERRLFQGRCFAIIRATATSGRITLTASAPGLKAASITIEAVAPSVGLEK
jgi:beta-galactosidase